MLSFGISKFEIPTEKFIGSPPLPESVSRKYVLEQPMDCGSSLTENFYRNIIFSPAVTK
jgi:hypothetical protein